MEKENELTEAYTGTGLMINSDFINGLMLKKQKIR